MSRQCYFYCFWLFLGGLSPQEQNIIRLTTLALIILPTFESESAPLATPGNLHLQSSTAVTHCLLIATHFTNPRKDDSMCQAQECHWELNQVRWRQRRVRYHTATCSPCLEMKANIIRHNTTNFAWFNA